MKENDARKWNAECACAWTLFVNAFALYDNMNWSAGVTFVGTKNKRSLIRCNRSIMFSKNTHSMFILHPRRALFQGNHSVARARSPTDAAADGALGRMTAVCAPILLLLFSFRRCHSRWM